jgi:putative endonuclease
MAEHNRLGKKGENEAVEMLTREGYEILHRNWRYKSYEIDIVAKDENDLVIIEVKTRSTDYYGKPEEAVNLAKQKFLIRSTEALIRKYDYDLNVRYDIISVIVKGNNIKIDHIKDAFYPE